MDVKELAIDLAKTETEQGIIGRLKVEGFWDDIRYWRPLGDDEGNYSSAGNQQSGSDQAFMEKIMNAEDACLTKECLIRGVDPESKEAPQSTDEAVERYFGVKRKNLIFESNQRKTELANKIIVASTEQDGQINLCIVDKGEGQSPKRMPDTILSLHRKNKQKIQFTQGKYNMGGTGALSFCGENNLQVIISRRCQEIPNKDGDETYDLWSVTVVRLEEPREGYRTCMYTYLTDEHGDLLTFKADALEIVPLESVKGVKGFGYESMKDGTFIKLMNYQMGKFNGPLTLNYFYRLNALAPQLALPVRIRETRTYKGNTMATNLYGLIPRLQENGSDVLEENYPTDFSFTVDGQRFDGLIYLFKPGKEENYRRYREGVLLTLNGQSQAIYPHLFFNEANLSYIRSSLLVIVDCTNVDAKHQNKLFMPSRDRVRDSEFTKEMVDKILAQLREHPGLKRIANERRANALKDKIADEKPLKDTLRNILAKSPVLSKLFLAGREISAPFNMSGVAGETKKFKGKKHPTFFELSGKVVDGKLTKHVPCNKTFRVKYLTDAENGYFSRLDDPGRFVMKLDGAECDALRESFSLIDGVVTLCVALPEGAKPGDQHVLTTEIDDDCILNRFERTICVEIGDAEETNVGGSGDHHKPRDQEKNGNQKAPQGFAMPEIKPVRKDDWALHGMDGHSALVYYPSEAGGDYYLNMDNDYLLAELKSRRVTEYITLTETRYHCCMALIAMSVISYYKTREKDDQEEQMDVEEAVRKITSMIAPVLIPMLESMADLTVDEVTNVA